MTAALFRRSLFDQIGPLDETFESFLEDVDFGIRCALQGRWGVYEPQAMVYHRGSSTWGAWNKHAVRLIARNQVLLTAKYFRGLSYGPIMAGQLLWGLVALRHGCTMAYLQGKIAGMRAARKIPSAAVAHRNVEAFVRESDQTIREIQDHIGFDRYWEAYFWLSGR